MIKNRSADVLEVIALDRETLENDLNTAEEIARRRALQEGRCGILVTRHDYTSFTIAVSRDVPYGLTQERQLS